MKLCPNCKTLNDDSERYCIKCRYKLDNAEFVENPKIHRNHYIGFIIMIAVIVVGVILAIFMPKLFEDKSKQSFGQGFIEMLPPHTSAPLSITGGYFNPADFLK